MPLDPPQYIAVYVPGHPDDSALRGEPKIPLLGVSRDGNALSMAVAPSHQESLSYWVKKVSAKGTIAVYKRSRSGWDLCGAVTREGGCTPWLPPTLPQSAAYEPPTFERINYAVHTPSDN